MAVENAGGLASQVPEYVQYVAWTVITVVGTLAVRFGWFTNKDSKPTHDAQLLGGVVDNRGIKVLAEAIDDAVDEMKSMHDERIRRERMTQEIIESLAHDTRKLTDSLVRVFEKMGK